MTDNSRIIPFSLKDAPSLIEKLFPVQKLSAEVFKERMAGAGQTLTSLGSFWKGRKPLVLSKACLLGCLLPATEKAEKDLEIFERLMAMDDESFAIRRKRRPKPKEVLGKLHIENIEDYFAVSPRTILPKASPIDWSNPAYNLVEVQWKDDLNEKVRRTLEARLIPKSTYRERVSEAYRYEEVMDTVHLHIWGDVNTHLGTNAYSFPELIEQLGIMRFGHLPKVADTFCGSGQIPFEAARLGCDVFASDLNPVACMLTWGAFNLVGGSSKEHAELTVKQMELVRKVQAAIDPLSVETDGNGWQAKVFLYCVEVRCPQTGWMVPLLSTRIISKGYRVIAELVPDAEDKRYEIAIKQNATDEELEGALIGTIRSDGRGQDPYMAHFVDGRLYTMKISTLRGDFRASDGSTKNRLRLWNKSDFKPQTDDIFQERLYCVQWSRQKLKGKGEEYEFRKVTPEDMKRECDVQTFVAEHLEEWQEKGWIPDMRIEPGEETARLLRERGWTYWHHLFNPRQLLVLGLIRQFITASSVFPFCNSINVNSKLSRWNYNPGPGRSGKTQGTFDNQALNTLFNYGTRSWNWMKDMFEVQNKTKNSNEIFSLTTVRNLPANREVPAIVDIFLTDPPYGDAVKYEEILEFFIAWLRKNPPEEFSHWIWDSRRTLAIKGEEEDFRRNMVASYRSMAESMPENGIQVIMFTHQSGRIWADMANIIWAAGLQVTAAWYVVTETDSAIRTGANVKGTVLLVCRKRQGSLKSTRDDLAWEIQEEVQEQINQMNGLNQKAKGLYRDENVFEDADIQMAGYAAALRVLTRYSVINGKDMAVESLRPRINGEKTFVDDLIDFAVELANRCLVPHDLGEDVWKDLVPPERFYLKLLDLEAKGIQVLDNYQNFAKAFKVKDFSSMMASEKANAARLKGAVEFGGRADGGELGGTSIRAVLYALAELVQESDGEEVLAHLNMNIPDSFDSNRRKSLAKIVDFLAGRLESIRPEEAQAARILGELIRNQRLG